MKTLRTLAFCAALAAQLAAPVAACPECEKLAKAGLAASGTGTKWSDPATWAGGKLPQAGNAVVIPEGKAILLDVAPPQLKSVLVKGQLRFDRKDIELKVGWVLVVGKGALLEIGTEAEPFKQKAAITFFGTDEKESIVGEALMSSGTKFLLAMDGGKLELHGASRDAVSWTQLGATAEPGATKLTLKEEARWVAGDKLCVAPSGYSPFEAEEVTVTAVAGKVVTFEPALKYKHWGTLQTIEGKVLDERAEVGLLTRNVVLRGADDSRESDFGGHVMVMPGGTAHVEGVEFFRMGQKGHQARYPMHWHLVDRYGDGKAPGKGQYAKNNSIHHSFQRAIVVHGTSDVLVEGNVAFDVTNHCYVPAEDGDEERNVFRKNLGMLVRVPALADYSFPGKKESSGQQENKASVFWMTNPNQVFEGNHAAGSSGGDGFLFDGRVARGRTPAAYKSFVFTDNVAHSNQRKDKLVNSLVHYGDGVQNFGLSFDRVSNIKVGVKPEEVGAVIVRNFTAYKNASGAVWLESQRELVKDSIFADHYVSAQFGGGGGRFDSVVILRRSENGLGEEFLAGTKQKAPSVGLYLENGVAHVVGKDMTFIGMDTTAYGSKRLLEDQQRLGTWKFINVAEPVYAKK